MSQICESWTLEDLVAMDEADMQSILGFYKAGTIPSIQEIHGGFKPEDFAFDGSFGWW